MSGATLSDEQIVEVLQHYLNALQGHPSAEQMLKTVVTEDFATGFVGGHEWRGPDGLRNFLTQRDGFFDEQHIIEELLERAHGDGELHARTRLRFFLRRWEAPSPASDEYTGSAVHIWRVRQVDGDWRVAAQMVEGFADLNDNAQRLFATPDEGLNPAVVAAAEEHPDSTRRHR